MTSDSAALDFSRSYCYYVPAGHSIWVRIQAECLCEVIDDDSGVQDEYVLGVRTQTGLRTDPPSDHLDPGYDFWMTFSRDFVYIKRNHASVHTNNPTRVPVGEFTATGWSLERVSSVPLSTPADILAALKRGERLTARTTFEAPGGRHSYRIEYPIKWADGDEVNDAFRVETGPVLLLNPEHVRAGVPVEFDDFTWSYLDYHDFSEVRCLIERPTSIFTGATYPASPDTPRRYAALTPDIVAAVKGTLFGRPGSALPDAELDLLLQTNHYSDVDVKPATTEIFSLDG